MGAEETILNAVRQFMWDRGLYGKVEGSHPLHCIYLEIRRTNHVFQLELTQETHLKVVTHRRQHSKSPSGKKKESYHVVETINFDLNDPDSLQSLYEYMQSRKRR